MPDYITTGNKTAICKHCKCSCQIPFHTTIYTCPTCGGNMISKFYGTVIDKNGNYVY